MPVVDPRIAGKPVPRISKERMERESVARVKNVEALDVAFLDQRIPRYERDIINMVGMGVTENAALKPAQTARLKLASSVARGEVSTLEYATWKTTMLTARASNGRMILRP
jgi:hypothetical protein